PLKVLLPTRRGNTANNTSSKPIRDIEDFCEDEKVLFEELREWRIDQARKEGGIPAFQVLSNRTLEDLALRKPQNDAELMEVFGIGEMKAKKYGNALLDLMR
ncbi:MAG: HRDC domain-containing protein, partial [Abditibacteriaceae bacterium]